VQAVALHNGDVLLFVCCFVRSFVCRKKLSNLDWSVLTTNRKSYTAFQRTHSWTLSNSKPRPVTHWRRRGLIVSTYRDDTFVYYHHHHHHYYCRQRLKRWWGNWAQLTVTKWLFSSRMMSPTTTLCQLSSTSLPWRNTFDDLLFTVLSLRCRCYDNENNIAVSALCSLQRKTHVYVIRIIQVENSEKYEKNAFTFNCLDDSYTSMLFINTYY